MEDAKPTLYAVFVEYGSHELAERHLMGVYSSLEKAKEVGKKKREVFRKGRWSSDAEYDIEEHELDKEPE